MTSTLNLPPRRIQGLTHYPDRECAEAGHVVSLEVGYATIYVNAHARTPAALARVR